MPHATAPSAAPASRSSGASAASSTASSIRSRTAAARCASCSRSATFNTRPPATARCSRARRLRPLEREPAKATVRNVGRLTTPTFGLGLVDAMPDSFFDGLAAAEPAAHARVGQPRSRSRCPNPAIRPRRRRDARRPLRVEGGRAQPDPVLGRRVRQRDGHHHPELLPRRGASPRSRSSPRPTASRSPTAATTCAPRQTGPNPGGLTATQWAQVDDAVGACARRPHRDPGRCLPVRRVHDRAGAGAARLQRSHRDRRAARRCSRRSAARAATSRRRSGRRRIRRPSPSTRRAARASGCRELRLQPLLGLLGPRHGGAGRHDRQRAAIDDPGDRRRTADADGAALGHPLPQPPAARRPLRRRRLRGSRARRPGGGGAERVQRALQRATSTTSCSSSDRCKLQELQPIRCGGPRAVGA